MSLHDVFDKYTKEVSEVEEKTVIENTGVNYDNIKNLVMNEIHGEQEQNRTKKGSNIMLFRKVIPFAAAFAFVIAAAVVGTHFLKKDVPVTPVDPSATAVTSVTDKQEDVGKKGSNGIWEYTEYAESVTLTRYLAAAPGDKIEEFSIPESINGKYVTDMSEEIFQYFRENFIEISKWDLVSKYNKYFVLENNILFNKDKTILFTAYYPGKFKDSYTIPNSVKYIYPYAFSGQNSLKSITIPDSVVSIGSFAFEDCDNLNKIVVSNKLEKIGMGIFQRNAFFENKNNWKDGVLYVTASDGKTIYLLATNSEELSGTYTINPNTKIIAESAFSGSEKLTGFNINKDNKYFSVVDGVLFNKDKTELISYPSGKPDAEYTVPESVKSIGEDAFRWGYNLKEIIIGNNVTEIKNYAFHHCNDLEKVTIGKNVKSLGNYCFICCENLQSVIFNKDSNLSVIGAGAFLGCTNLESVTMGNNVTTIGDYAFEGCKKLASLTIGNGVKSVGKNAFMDCVGLKSVKVPKSVNKIDLYAFGYFAKTYTNSFGEYLDTASIEGFTIYGASGSAAEKYAKDNSFKFIAQ